jgi:hypothetical protein
MKKIFVIAGILTLMLGGCASSGPTVVSNTAPGVKFKSFESYNFIQPLGTDRRDARTPMSSMLMNSTMREMAERGLRRSDESPDLLVDFIVTTEERLDVRQTPNSTTMHRSHWNRSFSTWPTYQTTVRQYTQGTLIIDLIDMRANAVIAEGIAEGRIRSSEFSQSQADELVRAIVKDIW